jgi:ParB family chromosome partitioning protein
LAFAAQAGKLPLARVKRSFRAPLIPAKARARTKEVPMAKPTKRLGRGLSSLVSDVRHPTEEVAAEEIGVPEPALGGHGRLSAEVVSTEALSPNPFQPREHPSDASLISLAESLRTSGMIQPISARRISGRLEIIAGERRWRAAQMAGLGSVPVIVREATDREMLEMALVENIHREDLNAIDRARAYRHYCDRFDLTGEEVARRLGEDRSTVANYLRLLDLGDEIKGMVAEGKLSMGHARCIVGVPDAPSRLRLAKATLAHGLSVRALESVARREKVGRERAEGAEVRRMEKTPHLRDLEERLGMATGTKVTIVEGHRKGTGRLMIEYYSLDDFERISALLGVSASE